MGKAAGSRQDAPTDHAASLSDQEIQEEIDRATAFEKSKYGRPHSIWREVEKDRSVVINYLKPFGKVGGQEAVFLTQRDLIDVETSFGFALARSWLGQPVTLQEVKGWPHPGATRVLLTYWGSAVGMKRGVTYAVPKLSMTLTVDGIELDPLDGPAEPTRLGRAFPAVSLDPNVSIVAIRYWFLFDIPPNAKKITAAVILPDGHKDEKTFDASKLEKPTRIQAGPF